MYAPPPFLGSVTDTSSMVFMMNAQFSLRWRTENEVLDGTGEMTCANMRCEYHRPHSAPTPPSLTTLELPFAYEEKGVAKQALVKVVLCPKCVRKLMWKRTRKRLTEKGKAVVDGGDESRERESVEDPENHGQEGDSRDARRRHRVISPESRSVSPRPHKRHRGRSELSNKRVFDSHDNRKRHQKVHTEHGVVEGVEES